MTEKYIKYLLRIVLVLVIFISMGNISYGLTITIDRFVDI